MTGQTGHRRTAWQGGLCGLIVTVAALGAPVLAAPAKPPAPAPSAPLPSGPAEQIEEAERALAQAVAQSGIAAGFRQFAAPDAVMFLPDPVPAGPELAAAPWAGELTWRVQYVAVAPSGDLAFSAGPSLLRGAGRPSGGFYLTVWKRQPDGSWKFVLDHAADMPASVFSPPAPPPVVMNTESSHGPASDEGLREADSALNTTLPRGGPMAFAERLDGQAILIRANRPVAQGRKKALALVSDSPPILEASTLGGARSMDGSFGYTYGRARWSGVAGPRLGYYVRVWRATSDGWRLLADQLAAR